MLSSVFGGVRVAQSIVFCLVFCRSVCPFFSVLLITILFVHLRFTAFVIFWLPFCYLLITLFLSSDYPFVIFWLPFCYLLITLFYLLITLLFSSDYPFVIFWLPFCYLLITLLFSSDYPFVIFWLPFCYLQTFLNKYLSRYIVKIKYIPPLL